MRTAVDSSVLFDVLRADPAWAEASARALLDASRRGELVVSEVVWAEVCSALAEGQGPPTFREMGLRFDPMRESTATLAGALWRGYRAAGGKRGRVVADFLVGAHALEQADALLTRDRGFYRAYFAGLRLLEP